MRFQNLFQPNAIDAAIEECREQIAAQMDRVRQQARMGRDDSTSRDLLLALHRSQDALELAQRALTNVETQRKAGCCTAAKPARWRPEFRST